MKIMDANTTHTNNSADRTGTNRTAGRGSRRRVLTAAGLMVLALSGGAGVADAAVSHAAATVRTDSMGWQTTCQ